MNINDSVKVKLNQYGIDILKAHHEKLNEILPEKYITEFKLELDSDGYYIDQLWHIMNVFGAYMELGEIVPFDTEIIICKKESDI